MGTIGMNTNVSLSGVAPGPACAIPEDKKIFRVTTDVRDTEIAVCVRTSGEERDVEDPLPLPVPHMYSA